MNKNEEQIALKPGDHVKLKSHEHEAVGEVCALDVYPICCNRRYLGALLYFDS